MRNTAADLPTVIPVHVAVAVIENSRGEILLTRRPDHVHQGGLWEFPGGKVERNEAVRAALDRELHEELGITAAHAHPLIRVHHAYADKSVVLDVWRVTQIHGTPHGREGQPLNWVARSALRSYAFPEANLPIITAATLPSLYVITNEPGAAAMPLAERVARVVSAGARAVQLRAKSLNDDQYRALAREVIIACRSQGAFVLLNAEPHTVSGLDADGVHLSSARLLQLRERPLPVSQWVAASVHNLNELRHAQNIGVDFVVAGPVLPTASHPGANAMGWDGLRTLTEAARVPVYALGGMQAQHLQSAWQHGAQGIATISAIWEVEDLEAAVKEIHAQRADSFSPAPRREDSGEGLPDRVR